MVSVTLFSPFLGLELASCPFLGAHIPPSLLFHWVTYFSLLPAGALYL